MILGSVAASKRRTGQAAFGSYSYQAATTISNATDVEITNKTFTDSDFRNVNIQNCTNVSLHNLDFNQCGGGIYLLECDGTLDIGWIRGYNLVGPNAHLIQLDDSQMAGSIHDVQCYGGDTSDVISLFKSGGTDESNRLYIEDIAIEGTDWVNNDGSGIMLGDAGYCGYATLRRFTLLSPGSCGVAIAGGIYNQILDGVVYGAQRTDSNIGLYAWNQAADSSFGHEVSRNKVEWFKADGTHNNRWDGGNVGVITGWTDGNDTNQWGAPAGIDPETLRVSLGPGYPPAPGSDRAGFGKVGTIGKGAKEFSSGSDQLTGNVIDLLGDSRVYRVVGDAQPTAPFMHHAGFMLWARRLTHGAVQFNLAHQFGVGGYTTQEVIDNTLDSAVASDGDACVLMIGVNDWGESITQAQSLANIDTIVDAFVTAGKPLFICDDSPADEPSGAYTQHAAIRDHIRAIDTPGVYVVPTWNQVASSPDAMTPNGGMEDTVHYGPDAAFRVGQAVATAMSPYLPDFDLFGRSGVLQGGDYTGTSGSKLGGVTGTVPTGWTVNLESGTGTVVCSIDAADGYNWLVVTLTSGTAPRITVYSGDWDSGWTPGTDRIDMAVKCKIDAGSSNIIGCGLACRREDGTNLYCSGGVRQAYDGGIIGSTPDTLSASAMDFSMWLPHVVYPTGATQMFMRMEIRGKAAVTSSGVFRFALPQLRKYTGALTD